MNNVLLTTIKKQFKKNELFSAGDVKGKTLSAITIKEELVELVKQGQLKRFSYGFYYIPGEGEPKVSDAIELRYINNGSEVYGFYTGDCFISVLNGSSPTDNDKIEIMTNKATSGKKSVYMFFRRFVLRKPYVKVNKINSSINSFLSYITMTPLDKIKENYSILASFIKKAHLAATDVMELASSYPSKTASKLLSSDLYRCLWKH